MEYRIFFNLLVLAVVATLLLTRRMRFIEAVVFLAPFRAVALNIGLSFSAAEVLAILGIGTLLLVRRPERIRLIGSILPYLTYCVVSTVLLSLFVVEAIPVKQGNFLREEGRFVVQIILNTLPVYGLLFLIVNHIHKRKELIRALKFFTSGITVLTILGLVQFIVFKAIGLDLFPLGDYTGSNRSSVYEVVTQLGGWIRICSLAGEPKGLAATIAIGIAVLVLAGRFLPRLFSWYSLKAWIFGAALILTLSTGGIVLGALLVVLTFGFRFLLSRYNWNILRPSVLLPSILIVIVFAQAYPIIQTLVQNRLIDRIAVDNEDTGGGVEDFDQTILAFISDNPMWLITGTGWGNVHNLSQEYIPKHFAYYMKDTIFVSKSGYLKIISESGLIGMFLLLLFEVITLWQLYLGFKRDRLYKFFFAIVVVSWVAFMVRSNYVVYEYIILHGLAISLVYLDNKNAEKECVELLPLGKNSSTSS